MINNENIRNELEEQPRHALLVQRVSVSALKDFKLGSLGRGSFHEG
jgi:hypothetical protein